MLAFAASILRSRTRIGRKDQNRLRRKQSKYLWTYEYTMCEYISTFGVFRYVCMFARNDRTVCSSAKKSTLTGLFGENGIVAVVILHNRVLVAGAEGKTQRKGQRMPGSGSKDECQNKKKP